MLAFFIIFCLFYAILAFKRLDWALLLLILALPAYLLRFKIFGIPTTLLEAMILISSAVWLITDFRPRLKNLLKRNKQRIPYPFSTEIILIIILSFLAAGVAGFSAGALGIWKAYFFEPILVFILLFNVFKEKKDWLKILWSLLISAGIISLLAIYQKITGQFIANPFWAAAATRRVVSIFSYPNAVGLYLAPLIPLFLGWLFYLPYRATLEKSGQKILIILVIMTSLFAVYFAHSEGALIGLAAGFLIFGLFAGRRWRLTTLILSVIIIATIFLSAPLKNFVVTKFTLSDLSGQIRERQWQETFMTLKNYRIITGNGLDNYQAAVKPYHQEGIFFNSDNLPNFDEQLRASATLRTKYWQPVEIYLYPHNIFLNFWSEIGLIGALVFMWLIIKFLFISLKLVITYQREEKADRYLALGLMSSMIVIIIHGLVDVPYFKNDLSILFWIFFALLGYLNLREKYGPKIIKN